MADNFPTQAGQIDYLNQSPDLLNAKPQQSKAAPIDPGTAFSNSMQQLVNVNTDKIFNDTGTSSGIQGMFNEMDKPVGPQSVGYASPDVDKFRFQDDFQSRGFNANDSTNIDRWTAAETWGSALSKGWDSFGSRFNNSYVESVKGYGKLASALGNWDISKLQDTESETISKYYKDQKESLKNFVFVPPDQDNDIFSKKTVSDMIANSGFALGTIAEFTTEVAIDLAITALTGQGEVFASLIPKAGTIGAKLFGKRLAVEGAKEGAEALAKTAIKEVGKETAETIAKEGAEAVVETAAKTEAKSATGFSNFFSDLAKGFTTTGNESAEAIAQAGKVANGIDDAERLGELGKQTDGALRGVVKDHFRITSFNINGILKSKSFEDFALQVAKGTPLLGTAVEYGEKIAAGAGAGLSAGKLTGIGLRGVRRLTQEWNMAASEASMEGVTTYGDTLDQMVQGYKATHDGENPDGLEFSKMKEYASQASFSNYGTNMAILLATNQIQFGGMFNKFLPNQKWAKDFLTEGSEHILGVNRMFKGTKLIAQQYEKGFFGTYGLSGKIAKDFGKKQAFYEVGNALRRDLFKMEISEGLQENLQEITAAGWKEYYANKYKGADANFTEAFGKGLNSQLTKQGFNTFLQGAVTGSVIRVPTYLTSRATQALTNRVQASQYKNQADNPAEKMRIKIKEDINLVNDMYRQMSEGKIDGKAFNFNVQVEAAQQKRAAALKGSEYEWHNAQDNSILNGALTANQSGMIDTYIQAVRDMGDTMTNEQFESSFGVKLSDTKYKSAKEFTESVASDIQKYSDTIDDIRKNVKNMADPFMFKAGSKEQYVASMLRNAQEGYVKIIALNQLKGSRASQRAEAIASDITAYHELANSSNYALRVLTNFNNATKELGNVKSELKLLESSLQAEGLSADVKKSINEQIKDKQEEVDHLEKWSKFWTNRGQVVKIKNDKGEEVENTIPGEDVFTGKKLEKKAQGVDENGKVIEESDVYDEHHPEVLDTFRKLMNIKNKQLGISTVVSEKTARESFGKIIDFIRLDTDAKDYNDAYDGLYNPDTARQMMSKMMDGDFKFRLLNYIDNIETRVLQDIAVFLGNTIKVPIPGETEEKAIGVQEIAKVYNKYLKREEKLTEKEQVIVLEMTMYAHQVATAIKESDAYKNLIIFSINNNLGIQERELAQEQVSKISEIVQNELLKIIGKTDEEVKTETEEVLKNKDVISDEEYNDFVDKQFVTSDRIQSIADKIKKGEPLSEREQAMYTANSAPVEEVLQTSKGKEEVIELDDVAKARIEEIEKRIYEIAKEQRAKTGEMEGTPESDELEKE